MLPMVFLELFLPIFQISWRRYYGLKGQNRRSSEEIRWIHQEAWCGSCCHFHIDWCQRQIKDKSITAMLFLLWLFLRQGAGLLLQSRCLNFVTVYQFQLPSTLLNGITVLKTLQMFFIKWVKQKVRIFSGWTWMKIVMVPSKACWIEQ